jgi:hypothetical protein
VAWVVLALALLSLGVLFFRARAYRPQESQVGHGPRSSDES